MNNTSTFVKSTTEDLTIAELLGVAPTYDKLPQGWKHPKAIAQIAIGSQPLIKNLRTREWEQGLVIEYWELGRFLDVRCRNRRQMVFSVEHIAVKSSSG